MLLEDNGTPKERSAGSLLRAVCRIAFKLRDKVPVEKDSHYSSEAGNNRLLEEV